jgi:outer membrane receptor protein involved in Fe transport
MSSCGAPLAASLGLAFGIAPALAHAASPDSSGDSQIVVTARRLDQARATIQPQVGASTYTITSKAIEAMPGGANTALNQVILQAPGVAQDSYGQLHIRGEHNGLQFRLNGVILPEGLSVFSQALSPRLAGNVELITGALPAEYGLRTAGIVDITTKSGAYKNGGSISMYGGSHGDLEPSFEFQGSSGNTNFFVSGSYQQNDLGIESPDGRSDPLHDHTEQFQGFAYVEHVIDPQSRISVILGMSDQRFQIPDQQNLPIDNAFMVTNPIDPTKTTPVVVNGQTAADFPSQNLNENQHEATYYGVASYLHTTDRFTGQVSLFARYSSLTFTPDPLGDILYDGIAQTADKNDTSVGVQAEGAYHLNDAHTLRGGVIIEGDRSISDTSSLVIPVNPATGEQTLDVPINIIDNGAKTAWTYSIYLQDEWKLLSNLTLNYGVRFDQFDGYRDENQLSPRVNLVWLPRPSTTIHVGYARYFTPPPFELIASTTVSKFAATTAAPPSTMDTTPYAERANYFDVGAAQKVTPALTLTVDSYLKLSQHLIDEGQFGAPIILTPFNYQNGRQYGVELTASYARGPFTAYANFAYSVAQGEDWISSQFNFTQAALDYVANHYVYLDHDQRISVSAGASYLWRGTRFGGDLIYGSGLRADLPLTTPIQTPDGPLGAIPNGAELPAYAQVNLALSHRFEHVPTGPVEVRLDVINVFDTVYQIRNGSGIGVFAPQYGPRRGFFFGLTKEF